MAFPFRMLLVLGLGKLITVQIERIQWFHTDMHCNSGSTVWGLMKPDLWACFPVFLPLIWLQIPRIALHTAAGHVMQTVLVDRVKSRIVLQNSVSIHPSIGLHA